MKYIILILIFSNLFASCNLISYSKKNINNSNSKNLFKNGDFILKKNEKTKKIWIY